MKNTLTTSQAYQFALAAYEGSCQQRMDKRLGRECAYTKQMKNPETFQMWLGGRLSSRKHEVISNLEELKGALSAASKRTILRLLNESFKDERVMKSLIESALS